PRIVFGQDVARVAHVDPRVCRLLAERLRPALELRSCLGDPCRLGDVLLIRRVAQPERYAGHADQQYTKDDQECPLHGRRSSVGPGDWSPPRVEVSRAGLSSLLKI